MTATKKSATIAGMAAQLGVSTATVAKALNGQGRISPAMVEKVRNLARELKYVPNTAARALRTNVKDAVGVLITSDLVNPWYSQLVSLLESELAARGLSMLLALGKDDSAKAQQALGNFLGGRVRGVLAGPIVHRDALKMLQPALDINLPVVAFNSLDELPIDSVAIDQAAGARLAVEHLTGLGHRHILYLGCPNNSGTTGPGTRHAGYTDAMQRLKLHPEYLHPSATISRRDGYELTCKLLASRRREELPSAMFCHNDDMALGAMLALQQHGLRIPEDISLIGFDDIAESSYSFPTLTTIGGVMHELAAALVDTLQNSASTNEIQMRRLIPPKLISRASTCRVKNQNK